YSFFFSSRRRHTRFSRDWSSDVCSSDLLGTQLECQLVAIPAGLKWPVQLDIRQLDLSQLQTGSSKPQAGGVQAGIPAVLTLQPEDRKSVGRERVKIAADDRSRHANIETT